MIFKQVGAGRPYPAHGLGQREWAAIPPRQVRLDQLVTTKRELALDVLLDDDSTFYGDLFPHVVEWDGTQYLEDGLHRAVRAALAQRNSIHARVHIVADAATTAPLSSPGVDSSLADAPGVGGLNGAGPNGTGRVGPAPGATTVGGPTDGTQAPGTQAVGDPAVNAQRAGEKVTAERQPGTAAQN